MPNLTGIHHVSALTNDVHASHRFYTAVMGMRLVKRTVNQEDPFMYHLFYGDAIGSPGSDITYFHMPLAATERRGNNSISRITFRVGGENSLYYWQNRFGQHGVLHSEPTDYLGRKQLDFEDPAGLVASLVFDGGIEAAHTWNESPVPAEHQISGLGYSEITVPELEPTHLFLTDVLGLRADPVGVGRIGSAAEVHVYRMQQDGPAGEIHVRVAPQLAKARYGSGGVHHVALRVPDNEFELWVQHLQAAGIEVDKEIDRYYFKSIYVRDPAGIMFELATDGPGFGIDESAGQLGQTLALPPFLEPRRAAIEAHLLRYGPLRSL